MFDFSPEKIADISQKLPQFTADAKALDARYSQLVRLYPKQWAGMYKGELRVEETQQEVMDYFEGGANVVIKYLDPKQKTLILSHLVSAKIPVQDEAFKPGWLIRGVRRASDRVRRWEYERAKSARTVQLVR